MVQFSWPRRRLIALPTMPLWPATKTRLPAISNRAVSVSTRAVSATSLQSTMVKNLKRRFVEVLAIILVAQGYQIGLDHLLHQLMERCLVVPAQLLVRLARITQ